MANGRIYATRVLSPARVPVNKIMCPRCGLLRTGGGNAVEKLCTSCKATMTEAEIAEWRK